MLNLIYTLSTSLVLTHFTSCVEPDNIGNAPSGCVTSNLLIIKLTSLTSKIFPPEEASVILILAVRVVSSATIQLN